MTVEERLNIIKELCEINVTCAPNLADIKHHIDKIKEQLSSNIQLKDILKYIIIGVQNKENKEWWNKVVEHIDNLN
jgi:CRISPR/Cas system CSM-associated protein Csm2 small subunit